MNEFVAIIIVIVCYGLAIYLKLMTIEDKLDHIKNVELNMIERALGLLDKYKRKEE